VSEVSDSTDHLPISDLLRTSKLTSTGSRKSFWDEDFEHLAHGRAYNFSVVDDTVLSKRTPESARERLLRCLHQAEASSLFLVGRMEALELKESKLVVDLESAQKEMVQLRSEASELAEIRQSSKEKMGELKDKDIELPLLTTKIDELSPKVESYETRVQ